jgi:PiT family inorganic phosphate transporter
MSDPQQPKKRRFDKDISKFDAAARGVAETPFGIANWMYGLLFLVLVLFFATFQAGDGEGRIFIIIAGVIGGYMALNIGANDVANNVGPAVGSRALTMFGALIIAAVFETAGAILAGGDVVSTISKGIIDPALIDDSRTFILAMMAALLAAAIWINLATKIGAPVSTTHSIVGGVLGGGIAAVGFEAVNWPVMGKIAASWVISPVLGGLIGAIFLAFIKSTIIYREDKIEAAKRWLPVLVAIMAAAFSAYLSVKGLKRIWRPDASTVAFVSCSAFALGYFLVKPAIARQAIGLENRNKEVAKLFVIPLICAAALLSFAHGANDVANAVGPLAAIVSATSTGDIGGKVEIPFWVMLVGALGISAGLALFGPKLIRTVGEQITKLNPMRAYCVALSAAITVIIASGLGLPVSSTHIAVGAIFGVGFFREFDSARRRKKRRIAGFEAENKANGKPPSTATEAQLKVAKIQHRRLVRRRHAMTIAAAWLITVPLAALLSALMYFVLKLTIG